MTDLSLAAGRPAATPTLPRATGWLAVLSLAVGSFATVTTEFLPIGVLPMVARGLGVSEGTAGLMVTMPGILAALAARCWSWSPAGWTGAPCCSRCRRCWWRRTRWRRSRRTWPPCWSRGSCWA